MQIQMWIDESGPEFGGRLMVEAGPQVVFRGWLELLSILSSCVGEDRPTGGAAARTEGEDGERWRERDKGGKS